LISHRWPAYRTVSFPEQWFDVSECNQRIEEYFESISRNIRLKEHVLQLQSILRHYQHAAVSPVVSFVFSPQFITSHSLAEAPSYSLHHVLASRVNAPSPSAHGEPNQLRAILPIGATEGISPRAGLDSLETLVDELCHSPNTLLQHYGNDLNNSHRELLCQNASRSARVAVPSHKAIFTYHKECSYSKDKLFAKISAALAPSADVEEICRIAGLWPRITPRSILRQLARDRISTLPDHWKLAIMNYAVSFLRYQQSLRMLELSSSREYEELYREIETIHHDVLAESTPDWLLIQVRRISG
jgi:hypothetical protein